MSKYFYRHSECSALRRITICGYRPENSDRIYLGVSVCHPKHDTFNKKDGRRLAKRRARNLFVKRNELDTVRHSIKITDDYSVTFKPLSVAEDEVPGATFAKRAGEIIIEALDHFRVVDLDNMRIIKDKLEKKLKKFTAIFEEMNIHYKTM